MRRLNFAAALVALPSASGFVETWRAYDQAPYSYTWQLPVYANDTAGLGAGTDTRTTEQILADLHRNSKR